MLYIQGVKDKIVCSIIQQEKKTLGGLIIPETVNRDPQITCEIISVGDEVKGLSPGDIVFCHQRAGMDMMIQEKIYKVLKYDEVYAVIRDDGCSEETK